MNDKPRSLRPYFYAAAGYTVLTLVMLRPVIAHLTSRIPHDLGDPLLSMTLLWWNARNWARHSAWSVSEGLVVFRGGWLGKYWRFAETRKLQALEWRQSPLDRRWGMASLHFDTVGAGMDPALAIPYLPVETARRLYDELAASLR